MSDSGKPLLMDIKQASAELSASRSTINRLDAAGHFPNAFGGKGWGPGRGKRMIPTTDIEAYARSRGGGKR